MTDIAIIGMDCRFSGAKNIDEYWKILVNGIEAYDFLSDEYLLNNGLTYDIINHPNFVKCAGGLIEGKDKFDSSFFRYTAFEAEIMSPQIRIFHELVWNSLESAGYNPYQYEGDIGLFAGANVGFEWHLHVELSGKEELRSGFIAETLKSNTFLCSRIANKLNLTGPALYMDTACSTSLVAVDAARKSLLDGECDIAVAGGISISVRPELGYIHERGVVLSKDGHCRAFDENATGTVRSDGAGAIVMKRLEDALRDNDHIWAVIKCSAVNNDGQRKGGFGASSVQGQIDVLERALSSAGVPKESISYIEAHGTATALNDPAEVEALSAIFSSCGKQFCRIGSVKTNMGHTGAVCGLAGLLKTVLALKYRKIPPSLNFEIPSSKIDFVNSPFVVNDTLTEWTNDEFPLRAGVTSLGIGGTNVHVVVEEAPQVEENKGTEKYKLLLVSGMTRSAAANACENLGKYLEKRNETNLDNAAYILAACRRHFDNRAFVVCSSVDEAVEKLTCSQSVKDSIVKSTDNSKIIFCLDGDTALYPGICSELYPAEESFKEYADQCLNILQHITGADYRKAFYDKVSDRNAAAQHKNALVFILQYSLTRNLMHIGVKPDIVVSGGVGELVWASISGKLALKKALETVVSKDDMLPVNIEGQLCEQLKGLSSAVIVNIGNSILSIEQNEKIHLVSIVNPVEHERDDMYAMLEALGKLWLYGVKIDWKTYYGKRKVRRIPLPTYPFERKEYTGECNPIKIIREGQARPEDKPDKKREVDDWNYVQTWELSILPGKQDIHSLKNYNIVMFADESSICRAIADKVLAHCPQTVLVYRGSRFSKRGGSAYEINPAVSKDYELLMKAVKDTGNTPDKIIHLWGLSSEWCPLVEDTVSEDTGLFSIVNIVQSLDKNGISSEVDIEVVTSGIYSITGDEYIQPLKSTVLGAVKVIPLEYANIKCRNIDICLNREDAAGIISDQIIGEALYDCDDKQVAFRGRNRWLRNIRNIKLEKSGQPRIKQEGVYLVIGGLGGIGFTVAQSLAKQYKAKLVIVGRTELPERREWKNWLDTHGSEDTVSDKILKLMELEKSGAEILFTATDVSDYGQVKKAVDAAVGRFGCINGVIQSAGEIDYGGIVSGRTKDTIQRYMQSKVKGTIVVDKAFEGIKLDFFVMFSSLSNEIHHMNFGQISYCSANAFLDNYADYKASDSSFYLTINWGIWSDVGMSVNSRMHDKNSGQEALKNAIPPQEGLKAFHTILGNNINRVSVSSVDLIEYIEQSKKTREKLAGSKDKKDVSKVDIEQFIMQLFKKYVASVDLIKPDEDFFGLGGDSLTAINLITDISKNIGVTVSLTRFMENATISGLVKIIKESGKPPAKNNSSEAENKQAEPKAVEVSQKKIANILPFNDIFYKECFFNAFFPVAKHFNKDISSYMCNEVEVYKYSPESSLAKLEVQYRSSCDTKEIIKGMGIGLTVHNRVNEPVACVKAAIANDKPVIVKVDCFYLPLRKDTFNKNHFIHNILVYGYDDAKEIFYILEHSDINILDYEEQVISYNTLKAACEGFAANFGPQVVNGICFEIYDADSGNGARGSKEYQNTYIQLIKHYWDEIFEGIESVRQFYGDITGLMKDTDDFMAQTSKILFYINNILQIKHIMKFKLNSMLLNDEKLLRHMDGIIDDWTALRNVITRISVSKIFKEASLLNALARLDSIISSEKAFYNEVLL